MKRWFLIFATLASFTLTPDVASADVSGLVPCKDSAVFKRRLDGSVKKLTARLENYEEGTYFIKPLSFYFWKNHKRQLTYTKIFFYNDRLLPC